MVRTSTMFEAARPMSEAARPMLRNTTAATMFAPAASIVLSHVMVEIVCGVGERKRSCTRGPDGGCVERGMGGVTHAKMIEST